MYPGYRIKHFILPVSDCISERLYMHINIFFVSVRPGGGPAPQPPLDHPRSTSSARKFSATDGGAATTADATAAAAAAVFTAPAGLGLPAGRGRFCSYGLCILNPVDQLESGPHHVQVFMACMVTRCNVNERGSSRI